MEGLNGYYNDDEVRDDLSQDEQEAVIEGLGRFRSRFPNFRQNKKYVRRHRSFINRYGSRKRNTIHTRAMKITPTKDLTAKAEFQARMGRLPREIREQIKAGKLQILDYTAYGTRMIGGQTSAEILHNADDKEVGRTNVNARKLEKDQFFLCTGVVMTSGVGAAGDNTIADLGNVTFGRMPAPMLNGEFSLEVGKKVLIAETPMEVFNSRNQSNVREGYFKLDNPKWIDPQAEIVCEVKLPVAAAAKTYIKVQLEGAVLSKK